LRQQIDQLFFQSHSLCKIKIHHHYAQLDKRPLINREKNFKEINLGYKFHYLHQHTSIWGYFRVSFQILGLFPTD